MSNSVPVNAKRRIAGKFTIKTKLGSGAFGKIHRVTDAAGRMYAAKFEPRQGSILLEKEHTVMQSIAEFHGDTYYYLPRPVMYTRHYDHMVLVMPMLGKSVARVFSDQKNKISTKTLLLFGIMGLRRIEEMHKAGYVHYDVKPDNFLLGGPFFSDTKVFLVDYNLSEKFVTSSGRHVSRDTIGFAGTVPFGNRDAHASKRQARRSDLESFVYTLAYLANDGLPWERYYRDRKRTWEIKQRIPASELFKKSASCFAEFFRYVRGLSYEEQPDYSYCRGLFRKSLKARGYCEDYRFDWVRS